MVTLFAAYGMLGFELCQALHKPNDSAVFLCSRSVQRRQVVEYSRIELIRVVPRAGQAENVALFENRYRAWIGTPTRTGYYTDGDVPASEGMVPW